MTVVRKPRMISRSFISSLLLLSTCSVDAHTYRTNPVVVLPPYAKDASTFSSVRTVPSVTSCQGGSSASSSSISRTNTFRSSETDDADDSNDTSSVSRGGSTRTMRAVQEKVGEEASAASSRVDVLAEQESIDGNETSKTTKKTSSWTNTSSSALEEVPKKKRRSRDFLWFLHHHDKKHKQIAKTLKNRNATNLRRKVMHAAFGLGFALLNHVVPKSKFVPAMACLSASTLLMELLRYRKGFGWMNTVLHLCLGSSLRKHEMEGKFTGSFYFFTGVTVTAALYSPPAATLAMAQLALADPSASYFGKKTRHIYWSRIEGGLGGIGRNKGFLGCLGGALVCLPFNYRVLSLATANGMPLPGGRTALVLASLALGWAGALADLAVPTPALTLPKRILGVRVPPFHVDDNMVVPIVSGFAATKIFDFMKWPQDMELARWLIVP